MQQWRGVFRGAGLSNWSKGLSKVREGLSKLREGLSKFAKGLPTARPETEDFTSFEGISEGGLHNLIQYEHTHLVATKRHANERQKQ